jgi:phosphoglycerate dehydrogenase-like enzyme
MKENLVSAPGHPRVAAGRRQPQRGGRPSEQAPATARSSFHEKSLPEDELKARIAEAHFVGIRSRTQLTAEVLSTPSV